MLTVDLISRKRDGQELTPAEISFLINGYMAGDIPDYQISAWLMAVFFRGMSMNETLALTDALVDSGERLDFSTLGPVLDKHSTGGVGDKVTLVLGPVIAACGAVFGKLSGSGLGHTGGTVDKLQSIPGLRTQLTSGEFVGHLRDNGLCIAGQCANMVPADMKLYALRDSSATIESNPLLAASIMSKKIAGGAAAVVLDIKVGRGAFFRTRGHASGASHIMRRIGEARGIRTETVMTSMEQPLGHAVGNALEVLEAVETLRGRGPDDLKEVVIALAARLLFISGSGWRPGEADARARAVLSDGSALTRFRNWIEGQSGNPSFIDDPQQLGLATEVTQVRTGKDGWVESVDALQAGLVARSLGAGRTCMEDRIDHGVGIVFHKKIGDAVSRDDVLATIYARDRSWSQAAAGSIMKAISISSEPVQPLPPLLA